MISKIEKNILQNIGSEKVSISQLAQVCKLSRPAIQAYVNKLVFLGVVSKNTIGPKKVFYSVVDKSVATSRLQGALTATLDSIYSSIDTQKTKNKQLPLVVSAFRLYLTEDQKKRFRNICDFVEYEEAEDQIDSEIFLHRYQDAEIAFISFTFDFVTPELLKKCTKLKHVVTLTKFAGVYINPDIYKDSGISFWDLSEPDTNYIKHSSKEFIILALLSCLRPIHNASIDILNTKKTGAGVRDKYMGSELHGKNIGIIGVSNSALHILPILRSFGANIKIHNPDKERVDMYDLGPDSYVSCYDLFQTSDVVIYTDNYYKTPPKLENIFSDTMRVSYMLILGEYDYTPEFFKKCRKYIVSGKFKGVFLDYLSKKKIRMEAAEVSENIKHIMYLPNVHITPFIGPVSTHEAVYRRGEYAYSILEKIIKK